MKALVILLVFSGMVAGQTGQIGQAPATTFKECYAACFILCIIVPPHSAFNCSLDCLRDCLIPKTPQGLHADNTRFCQLGCASSLCANISTKQNSDGEKVESCVGSCSEQCTRH
ncbi:hypothetical protein NMG60_11004984 [Bertholletia excelsa]